MKPKNAFVQAFSGWFQRNFSSPDAVSLFFTVLLAFVVLECFGRVLLPILMSVVLAYLLLSLVNTFMKLRCPRGVSVGLAFTVFIAIIVFILLTLLPMLWRQLSNLAKELPYFSEHAQILLKQLTKEYPHLISHQNATHWMALIHQHAATLGQHLLSYALNFIPSAVEIVLYFILVPIMVFFFVKDSRVVTQWVTQFLPLHRTVMNEVWREVNGQIANYIRGRVMEIILVGAVSVLAFTWLGLPYAVLLGALVGLSVIVPYVGAVLITIPIVVLGLLQWGFGPHFWYMILVYSIIIVLDANVLVPLLFSEAMDLHPVAIIIAVLIFGGIWGFWGVFFAIPLATVVNAIIHHWPSRHSV